MRKVHEAWDLAHSQISSPISPFSTKPTLHFEAKVNPGRIIWKCQHGGHGKLLTGRMRLFLAVSDVPDALEQQLT